MMVWLVDTAIYSGLLIVLVLALRRPVARWFGPQMAYSLWMLPLLRLLMPPIVLPASLAPLHSSEAGLVHAGTLAQAGEIGGGVGVWLLAVWLGGAAALLAGRALGYFPMRRELLIEAETVGQSGAIRLVESPSVSAPLAFGVTDKIIALPPGFMAQADHAARDLAIAHELAHHRGHDLLANVAAQLLLALHWFNPLAWLGWRAMRRDQEAACDARVMHGLGRQDRAAYAQVIAGFAAGPQLALAAPMACPLLGEKSIVHRLRTLSRKEVSTGRRHIGRAGMVLAVMALPVTASISYAHAEKPPTPVEKPAPQAAPIAQTSTPAAAPIAPVKPIAPPRASRPAPEILPQKLASAPQQPASSEIEPGVEKAAFIPAPVAPPTANAPRMIRVQWEVTVQQFGQPIMRQRVMRYALVVACPADTPPPVAADGTAPAALEKAVATGPAEPSCRTPQEV